MQCSTLSELVALCIDQVLVFKGGSYTIVKRKINSGALPHRNKRKPMPSMGMRRSTRVFGTRVLRSGRRLRTEPHGGSKYVRAAHGENKFPELLDNSADGGGDADDRHKDMWDENENSASVEITAEPRTEERASDGAVEVKNVDSMCGLVYRRKRKRAELTNIGLTEDERYGKKFVRKQWRTKCRASESFETCGDFRDSVCRFQELAIVVKESSYDCGYWITCFLTSVLSYMTRFRIGMRRLSAFILSKPIFDAYSSRGMLFLQVNCYPYKVRWLLDNGCMCLIRPNLVNDVLYNSFSR